MRQLLLSIIALLGVTQTWGYSCKVNGICYDLNWDAHTATVTYSGYPYNNEYTGHYGGTGLKDADIVIPSTITYNDQEYTVTAIGDKAFYDCESSVLMSSITIPSTVTSIGSQAFWKCTNLTSITIPSSVTYVGSSAFYRTAWFNNLPDGIVYAGKVAYGYKGEMPTNITIEDGTISIADGFCLSADSNSDLTSLSIPSSVTSIGAHAYQNCASLTSISIPNSVITIGAYAFFGTAWLNNQPDGLVYAGKVAYSYKGTMPSNCAITLEEGTLGVAGEAFRGCSALTSIVIPNSVTSIGEDAFSGCSNLICVSINSNSIVSNTYSYNNNLRTLFGSKVKEYLIGEAVESIGNYAFDGCSGLTSVTISNSVTNIGDYAFDGCSGLTSVTIPNSVNIIGNAAFLECSGLTSVAIPNSVTSIGNSAFYICSALTSVTVEIDTPLPISSFVFSNRANATLYVPYGCKAAYEAADYWKDFKEIVEMQATTEVDLSISDAGIGTYCSEYDLDFTNSEVKAYIVSAFTPSTGKVLLTRIYDVPANTGIVVKGDEGDFQIPTKNAETLVANMLVGVTEDTQLDKVVGDYTNYILAKKAGEIGFYAVSDGSTLKAHKAYLPLLTASLPSSSRVAVVFDDEEATTFINEVGPKDSDILNTVYNLNGQRLSGLQKGLNIINGKKVIIK